MSISVVFYTFSKEVNSTAQPTGAGTSFDCILRSDTSVISPSIELMTSGNPCSYNYCHISDFGRYYFVQDWISVKGRWVAKLTVDVLATYKSQITASSQYVSRSASSKDEYISDGFYPCTTEADYSLGTTTGTNPFDHSTITYVTGIIGDTDPIGSVTYYAFTESQLKTILTYMSSTFNDWSWINTTELSEGLQKALINPFQYIVSCHALPLPRMGTAHADPTTFPIKFGPYEYIAPSITFDTVYTIPMDTTYSRSLSYTVPSHPQASTIGKYLNAAPYSEYAAFVGPFGEIPIDPQYLVDESSITYKVDFDYISGDAILHIYNSEGIGGAIVRNCHVGVDIPLSALSVDVFKQVTGPMDIIASASNIMQPGAGYASSVISGINDYMKSKFPQVEKVGSQGSFIGWTEPVRLTAKFLKIVGVDNARNGSPLMQHKTLSTLSGFTLIMNPDVSIPGTSEESESIKNFMLSGIILN